MTDDHLSERGAGPHAPLRPHEKQAHSAMMGA